MTPIRNYSSCNLDMNYLAVILPFLSKGATEVFLLNHLSLSVNKKTNVICSKLFTHYWLFCHPFNKLFIRTFMILGGQESVSTNYRLLMFLNKMATSYMLFCLKLRLCFWCYSTIYFSTFIIPVKNIDVLFSLCFYHSKISGSNSPFSTFPDLSVIFLMILFTNKNIYNRNSLQIDCL